MSQGPHDPDGGDVKHLLAAVDQAGAQLQLLRERADEQASTVMATVLAAAVAHEINNILTPVRSFAQYALSRADDSEVVMSALRRAAEGAERAGRAAEAILDSVRPGVVGRSADVRLAVLEAVRMLGEGGSESISIDVERDARAAIGQAALEQLLLNLLLNARAASPTDRADISIRSSATWNTSGQAVTIEVEDAGCGIPSDRLETIFEPFVTGGRRVGNGLGLMIAKHLVEAAGGRIAVRSQLGVGSCFTVQLPAAAQSSSQAA